jgi:hypothetical protein
MKRIDYFWPRAALQITGIVFLTQVIVETIAERKPGFEWVLPACGLAFALAILWTTFAIVWNIFQSRQKKGQQ